MKKKLITAAGVAFWLIVWEIAALCVGKEVLLASPISVAVRLFELVPSASFWGSVLFTAGRVLLGFFLGMTVGVILAVAAGKFSAFERLLAPLISCVKSIPVASFTILALIWISSRNLSVLVSFLIAVPIVYSNMLEGFHNLDKNLSAMADVFRIPPLRRFVGVYLSQLMPYFRSAAVGYIVSKEKFWKRAMPWWSTMKIRYSNGWVGSDASGSDWLYYSSWKQTSGYYQEEAAANITARWETAHKQDLGFEMGFLKDKLTVNVDLYDEKRNDMLMPPVVTAFVGVAYKDVNAGALKKHGFEVEVNWKNTTSGGFTYSFGGMIGLSENRITKYGDAPYAPEYQKYAGTPLQSARTGDQLIDDRFFGSIDEIHGYPNYATEWTNVVPGVYKFLDYVPDGKISQQDLHVLEGSTYAPGVYSFNVGGAYKGLTFKVLCTGTIGKYINYKRVNIVPFYAGAYVIHDSHLNYWTPTNRDSDIPALSFSDEMYAWGGGTSTYPGYNLAIPDFTWKRSDYMTVKEVMVSYRFSGPNIKRILGVKHLAVGLVCNNLWTFSNIKDTDPQRLTTAANSYPTMRMLKLNVNLAF